MVSAVAANPIPATERAAFKETEIGTIPVEWEVSRIHEFASVKTGPFGTLLKASEYSDGDGVPLISVGEIRRGYLSITEDTPRVCDVVTKRLPQYVLKAGDIVFGRKGGVDRSALLGPQHDGWFLGSDGLSIRLCSNLDPAFIAYQFQTSRVQQWLLANAIGTTMPSLNQGILAKVAVAIPPTREEQEAVAQTLADADALITCLETLIAKKRAIKQGAMQELLSGRNRLPGFSGEWGQVRLDALADIKSGGTPSTVRADYWDGDVPWCTPTDITSLGGQKYLRETNRTITEYGLSSSSAEWIPAGSVVMTSRATIGECAINARPVTTNQGFKNLIPRSTTDVDFLYYLMCTQKERLIALCGGSTFLEIGKKQLSLLEVFVPQEKEEQSGIAKVLSEMDEELDALNVRLSKARQLKQGMMQELLTGRVRLV